MSVPIRRLDSADPDFSRQLQILAAYAPAQDEEVEATVSRIISNVRKQGDKALLEYTKQFDLLAASSLADLEVSGAELREALASLSKQEADALGIAAGRIRTFHEKQLAASWEYMEPDGTKLGQRVTPIDRVGLYVPGGKAAYPSSVLMNAIPAKVAGVKQLVMVSPTPNGERNPMVLAAAALSGVDRVICIGGAQAVAALAFG
ncbi:MAG TPA: histidinol dehydrogenase, partial [Xanthobacteraceae bacterium]|nr:histidinol dehydrogenase [Xanthobacteraceae bacterium]